jgi:hypothetical protein
MANFTFYYKNILNTTTMVTPSAGGTSTVSRLFDRRPTKQWGSGDTSDSTISTLQIDFSATTPVSSIVLENINLKSFKIYYNSSTANTLTLLHNITNASTWITNSLTNMYLIFSTIQATSIFIVASSTMAANDEKKIGQLWLLDEIHTFSYNPDSGKYKASWDREEFTHKMSDGGTVTYFIQDNFTANIERAYVESAEYTILRDIHTLNEPVVFVPFPTGTGWDGEIFECNWIGNFNKNYSSNYTPNGFDLSFDLRETPK